MPDIHRRKDYTGSGPSRGSARMRPMSLRMLGALLILAGMGLYAQRGNPRLSYGGQSIDDMIADFMAEQDVDGLALAIVQAPYIPRTGGYGFSDRDRKLLVASNTLFDLGQMAEAYT